MRSRARGARAAVLALIVSTLGVAPLAPLGSSTALAGGPVRATRLLHWSGYDWVVKDAAGRVGPGPNFFSDSSRTVWVDASGRLHLRIEKREAHWWCAELTTTTTLGYGTYDFELDTAASSIDRNAVLGLFTWDDAPAEHHREIDIELSRWGSRHGPNASFTVQPYQVASNGHTFDIPGTRRDTTQAFEWTPGRVEFWSIRGHRPPPVSAGVIERWTSTSPDVPSHGDERPDINLWLFQGNAPSDRRAVNVVLSDFSFDPAS